MSDSQQLSAEEGGWGGSVLVLALGVCLVVMFLPMLLIQHGYDGFTAVHGEAIEGAGGSFLALAVIFRTLSRTILRTVVRASARTGLRIAFKSGTRAVLRAGSSKVLRRFIPDVHDDEDDDDEKINWSIWFSFRSLLIGSVILYASWVIVVGLGQPFLEASQVLPNSDKRSASMDAVVLPGEVAWEKRAQIRQQIADLEHRTAASGAIPASQLSASNALMIVELTEYLSVLHEASYRLVSPAEQAKKAKRRDAALSSSLSDQGDPAPYPGRHDWSSSVIWLGGLGVVLPMWCIFWAQWLLAQRLGVRIRHETPLDGSLVQLYFAGALCFLPLSSDTYVSGGRESKAHVAVIGLLSSVGIAFLLLGLSRSQNLPIYRFLSDLFFIYPMVNVFPMSPLSGKKIWSYNKWLWLIMFIGIVSSFLFFTTEGIKNVI